MTHLSRLLDNAGIPENLKEQIREAVGKDVPEDATRLVSYAPDGSTCDIYIGGILYSYSKGRRCLCPDCEKIARALAAQEEA